MMVIDEDEVIDNTPMAHGACIIICSGCGRPHIVFLDGNDKPLLQYIVPEDSGFIEALNTANRRH